MPRDDEKEKDKKQGNKNGSQVSLRDPGFGPPELQPDGTYLVGFSTLVYWGSKPAWGEILWRPRVNGRSIIGFQIVVGGRIEYQFKLSGEKPSIAIDLKYGEWERTISLRDIELPKKSESKHKIEVVSTLHHDDKLEVVLRRVGKDGKSEAGNIMAWDFDTKKKKSPMWRIFEWATGSKEENFILSFQCRENARTLTFFLPDDKEVKVSLQIPAKQAVPPKKEEVKPKYELSSFEKGQRAFQNLVEKPLTLDVDFDRLSKTKKPKKSKENERKGDTHDNDRKDISIKN